MADVLTPEQRHKNMSNIRSKDTNPEIWLRKRIFERGYRYRKNAKNIPGHPDIWLAKYNTAVFIHGCFWHRHEGCKYASVPKSRVEFWNEKFRKNIERDERVRAELETAGIRMLIIWECTIKSMKKNPDEELKIMEQIESFFVADNLFEEL